MILGVELADLDGALRHSEAFEIERLLGNADRERGLVDDAPLVHFWGHAHEIRADVRVWLLTTPAVDTGTDHGRDHENAPPIGRDRAQVVGEIHRSGVYAAYL